MKKGWETLISVDVLGGMLISSEFKSRKKQKFYLKNVYIEVYFWIKMQKIPILHL